MRLSTLVSIFYISWSNGFIYRVNFIMWRVRALIQTLALYFLWLAVFSHQTTLFGYTQSSMLTYIILGSFVRALVFSSRSLDLQRDISSGDLNQFLLKPINIISYWFYRDLADKLLNLFFSVLEICLIIFCFKPPILAPPSPLHLFWFVICLILGVLTHFFLSLIISLTVFWLPEGSGWPQRFVFSVIIEFLSGSFFPLDILPISLYRLVSMLPTASLLSLPLQLYLNRLTPPAIYSSLVLLLGWFILFNLIAKFLFQRGLKTYEAYGQ